MKKGLLNALVVTIVGGSVFSLAQNLPYGTGISVPAETEQKQPSMDEAQFPFPALPATLRDAESRRDYLLKHYWDEFDFNNRALVNNRDVAEQGFVNFIALLADPNTPSELATAAMKNFCNGIIASQQASQTFIAMAENYLFDTRSPMYDEQRYALFLREMTQRKELDTANRHRMNYLLKLIERNRPGELATDFTYYTPDNVAYRLSATDVAGEYLILLFYDPECEQCHETLETMKTDPWLNAELGKGRVSMLAIYTEGEETVWRSRLTEMPKQWKVGNDRSKIKDHSLYDLKAMPVIYLLDKEKRVILKDAEYTEVKRVVRHL